MKDCRSYKLEKVGLILSKGFRQDQLNRQQIQVLTLQRLNTIATG
jgi:hypothetical protein